MVLLQQLSNLHFAKTDCAIYIHKALSTPPLRYDDTRDESSEYEEVIYESRGSIPPGKFLFFLEFP